MPKYLSEKPVLAIISDTAMYRGKNIYVFEPVLREVISFSDLFSKINWLGFGHQQLPPKNTKKKIPDNLKLLIVKPCGGNTIVKKMKVIIFIPYYIFKINQLVKISDVIHIRGPSIPALLTILFSFFHPQKKYWHKYAGNWQTGSKTISYRFQRWLLKKKNPGIVIVSKRNNSDLPHVLSFINPCLTEKEIIFNKQSGLKKKFNSKLTFCFVGRLEKSKGLPALLDAFGDLNKIDWIEKLHCVGGKSGTEKNEKIKSPDNIPVIFHGILDRQGINQIYEDSHFIILPSQSEGFPKVLAEASSFGCIPIVPPISSILSIINEKKENGIILTDITSQGITKTIKNLQKMRNQFPILSANAMKNSQQFSYEKYNHRIVHDILSN